MWIRDIQFITQSKIAIVTEYMDLRVYDMTVSKRPILNIRAGNHPLRSLATTEHFAVLGDHQGEIIKVGYKEEKMTGKYQGCSGSVVQLVIKNGKVYCVGMDRFLRVFGKDRKEEEKVYLKQRMSGVCLVVDDEEEVIESESDGEDVWNGMDDVDKESGDESDNEDEEDDNVSE